MKVGKKVKIASILLSAGILAAGLAGFTYVKVIPSLVSSPKTASYVADTLKKHARLDLVIENAKLDTGFNPFVGFKVGKILLKNKDGAEVVDLQNFDIKLSFEDIFNKHIIINKLGADYIFVDVNKALALGGGQKQEKKESQDFDWNIDFFSAKMFVKECLFTFKAEPDTYIRLRGKDFEINNQDVKNYIHFKLFTEFVKNNKKITIASADRDRIFIENKALHINDFGFFINKSHVGVNAYADNKKNHYLKISTKNFNIKDVIDIVESNLIISNGSTLLAGFKDLSGSFDSEVTLKNRKIDGTVKLNGFTCSLIPVNNLPIKLTSGIAKINNKDIIFEDIKGYYGKSASNTLKITGGIYDYFKTAKTNFTIDTIATNEFAENYLSKVVNFPFSITGKGGGTRIIFDALGTDMDLTVLFKLPKGDDLLVDGMSFSPTGYDRAARAIMHFKGDNINIETIEYYIAQTIQKGSKIKPILTLSGNVTMAGIIKDLGFDIPNPLPSEFLNLFVQQKVFKKGTIAGNLHYVNTGKVPKIDGNMELNGIIIPAQRLYVKYADLKTDGESIKISANGKYRRVGYDFTGDFRNALVFPVVVNNITLKLDELDIERILKSFNSQTVSTEVNKEAFETATEADMENDDTETAQAFNPGMILIKRCILYVAKGSYKEINFANVGANLTLDENNIMKVVSNRFDIAEGISSAKIECDLKNHLYSVILGIKDVNSDVMATALLALPREITGKASGLISLNTDDSLKLNGSIKFAVNNGTIQKIGLVEYVLKFAALFRNPLAMISPSTFMDLINVPNGDFDKITGELKLKNNVVENIMIKSKASQLSAFIVGRFDLETRDATLRIYTKLSNKGKGFAGALRNISLNSLANRVPLSSRNDSLYYAAELSQLPEIDADEKDCQVFLTTVDGDVEHNNFISSLKRIK